MPEIIVKLGDNIVHRYVFDKDVMNVGRARDNDIVIENLSVSRNHARIRREDDRFVLTDLNSANGSFVNGVRITRVEVVDGDVITIGKHVLNFVNEEQKKDEQAIGEAFEAERTIIAEETKPAYLKVSKGKQEGQAFKIVKYETTLGRASDNDIRLHDWFVSKKHAVVIHQEGTYYVKDLGSWRGTMVNGKTVRECELSEGDEIQLGTTSLIFTQQEEGVPEQITGRVPQELGYDEAGVGAGAQELEPAEAGAGVSSSSAPSTPLDMAPQGGWGVAATADTPAVAAAHRDEYAPLSEEELVELEEEEMRVLGQAGEGGAGASGSAPGAGGEWRPGADDAALSAEEKAFAGQRGEEDEEPAAVGGLDHRDEDMEAEDRALLGASGSVASEKGRSPASGQAAVAAAASPVPAAVPDRPGTGAMAFSDPAKEAEMWEAALKNKSKVIRRKAAQKLKLLTGREYDWESEPK